VASGLPATQRSSEWTVPEIGYAVTHLPQFLKVIAIDSAGQHGWDDMPLTISSNDLGASITINTDLAGQTFIAGHTLPEISYSGSPGHGMAEAELVLEGDGTCWDRSLVSTDRARVAVRAATDSNRIEWFFAPGYFTIRHDPRLGLEPPAVTLLSPMGGSFPGNGIVPISWTASAPEGLYAFDIQASYNGGRTWPLIAKDLPPNATSYQWQLPPITSAIPDVRIRVVVRDKHFQNSAADAQIAITIGGGNPIPGDVTGDGVVNVNDLLAVIVAWGACGSVCPADLNHDGVVNVNDLLMVITNWT
jgi:hypothetical protein